MYKHNLKHFSTIFLTSGDTLIFPLAFTHFLLQQGKLQNNHLNSDEKRIPWIFGNGKVVF